VSESLDARFARIRAFYRRHEAGILASQDDWYDDPYLWDSEGGIKLTPIESALWHDIRAEDLVLYPQYPVGRFFVDFGNPVWKVSIECDGMAWHRDVERDAKRQAEIERMGWKVYRAAGRLCLTDIAETEDDDGRPVLIASAAREFVRGIAAAHPGLRRCR
jgi:hypothetical protein